MKKIIISLFLFAFCGLMYAAPVSPERARQVAYQFCRLSAPDGAALTPDAVVDMSAATAYKAFYTFSLGEQGFVLVAGDDRALPILGYSFTSPLRLNNVPAQIAAWLDSYERQIEWLREQDAPVTDQVMGQWQSLETGRLPLAAVPSSVSPLISTTWDQDPYYNTLCPGTGTGSNRTVTGCVATATAQVMKFWNHPTTGRGSHSYTDDSYGTQSADFGSTTYQWSSMPNSLSGSSSSTQVNAIATLMYHIGVAIEMDYGTASVGGSAAAMQSYGSAATPSSEAALVSYFRYQPTVHCITMADYSDAVWASMLRAELDSGRPMLYEGDDPDGGHCFICDGYDNSNRFHFNWGWRGSYDGYYTIGSLNLGGGGTGSTGSYTFNLRNGALMGIQPMTGTASSTTTITASANNSSYGSVSGTGTFTSFTDTVALLARANSGYRFECWSDGYKHNPREFIASGGSHSFTAVFAPIAGDTITYSARTRMGQSNMGSPSQWGIRIPASSLTNGTVLSSVRLFVPSTGSYTVIVYTGTNSPSTQVYSGTINATSAGGWATLTLPTPVTVNTSQSLFVTFSSSASYPVAYTYYSGNDDASWVKYNGSWVKLSSYGYYMSWMIDAIFTSATGPFTITAVSNNDNYGTVTGGGTYAAGTSVWLEATPASGCYFVSWQDGNTSARRQITVTGNATYTATFAVNGSTPSDDCTVTSLPWSDGFEGSVECWDVIDADGDGNKWNHAQNVDAQYVHSGSSCMISESWNNAQGAFRANNYLISPKIQIPAGANATLSYYARSMNSSYADTLEVLVTVGDGTTITEFVTLVQPMEITPATMTYYSASLAAYNSRTIRIAFRHHSYDGQYLFLDDVKVSTSQGIDDATACNYRLWAEGRNIVISGVAGQDVAVFDVLGRCVSHAVTVTDTERIAVDQPGVYFISVDGTAARRVVVL